MSAGKGIVIAGSGNKKGKGIVRTELKNNVIFNAAFNGVFSRNNLPKTIKDAS